MSLWSWLSGLFGGGSSNVGTVAGDVKDVIADGYKVVTDLERIVADLQMWNPIAAVSDTQAVIADGKVFVDAVSKLVNDTSGAHVADIWAILTDIKEIIAMGTTLANDVRTIIADLKAGNYDTVSTDAKKVFSDIEFFVADVEKLINDVNAQHGTV